MKQSTVYKHTPPRRSLLRWLALVLLTVMVGSLVAAGLVFVVFYIELDRSLPSIQSLKNYHPPLVSSVYAADGSLIGEFYTERRYLVPLQEVPPARREGLPRFGRCSLLRTRWRRSAWESFGRH